MVLFYTFDLFCNAFNNIPSSINQRKLNSGRNKRFIARRKMPEKIFRCCCVHSLIKLFLIHNPIIADYGKDEKERDHTIFWNDLFRCRQRPRAIPRFTGLIGWLWPNVLSVGLQLPCGFSNRSIKGDCHPKANHISETPISLSPSSRMFSAALRSLSYVLLQPWQ